MRQVLVIAPASDFSRAIGEELVAKGCTFYCAAGGVAAIRQLRRESYDVVITNPDTTVEEDLALLDEMRMIRPGVRVVVLAPRTSPEEAIAALRARVFICLTAPFDTSVIADMAAQAAAEPEWRWDIELLSARRDWVSLRANCRLLNAERLVTFLSEVRSDMPCEEREDVMGGFREILLNAMEHGTGFDPDQVVEVAAVRTARAIVFYVRDPGRGFDANGIAAVGSSPPDDPVAHVQRRSEKGVRAGGFGILVARHVVDEMMYSELGNEVLLIKHTC